MAAKFRKIDPRMWTDEKFRRLEPDGKLLAIWLLTSSRVNRCGIVLWSPGLASEETGIHRNRIDTVCDTVCHTLNWVQDTVSCAIFLKRWWKYNQPDNEKALVGALTDLHDLPSHGLRESLILAAQDIKAELRHVYRSAIDTVCDTVSDTVCHTVCAQEKEKEQEKEQEQKQEKRDRPNRQTAFDVWWEHWPKKTAKQAAFKAYQKAIRIIKSGDLEHQPAENPDSTLLAFTDRYAAAVAKWPDDDKRFIPHPATWLNEGRFWDDPTTWERKEKSNGRKLDNSGQKFTGPSLGPEADGF